MPKRELEFVDEDLEWVNLTPAQRIKETTKLWLLYLALGGSLDPEPDFQSPFYFKDSEEKSKRQKDREYWAPLKKELETLRHKKNRNSR